MIETFKVVMLPTEKANYNKYIVINKENKLCIWDTNQMGSQITLPPQHLYIISDDEIKEGDWCLHQIQHEYHLKQAYEDNALLHYKIVATTDTSLTISKSERTNYGNEETYNTYDHKSISLSQLPKSFIKAYIKAYNEGKPITEVDLRTFSQKYLFIP